MSGSTYSNTIKPNGTGILDSTSAVTGQLIYSIVAREDTVVSVCTGTDASGNAYNFKTSLNWINLKFGDTLFAPDGYVITAITLTSGSVLLNKG